MARFYPTIDPRDIDNDGERIVGMGLAALSDEWGVYHSLHLERASSNDGRSGGKRLRGEIDFVLVHPRAGILVLEVKGGQYRYSSESVCYERFDSRRQVWEPMKDPFDQARRNHYNLRREIARHPAIDRAVRAARSSGESVTHDDFVAGEYAVVLPEMNASGARPLNVSEQVLWTADDLSRPEEAIARSMHFSKVANLPVLPAAVVHAIAETLHPKFSLLPALWLTLESEAIRVERMTEEQQQILDFMGNQARAAIAGVAGSGKTMLALTQAKRMLAGGQRVLFLTYNRAIADALSDGIPEDDRHALSIKSFHKLCVDVCRQAGHAFSPKDAEGFWDNDAPELLLSAASSLAIEHKYDALVCDEAQDFLPLWWIAAREVMRTKDHPWFVFFDPEQNIYRGATEVPAELGRPFVLNRNCRNTKAITRYLGEILGRSLDSLPGAPEGREVVRRRAKGLAEVDKCIREIVHQWCSAAAGSIPLSKVAILTPSGLNKRMPKRFGNVETTDDVNEWRKGGHVLLMSARRFKGLEADAVILAGIPRGDEPGFSRADHYVAASRGRLLLAEIVDEAFNRGERK